MAKKLLVFTDLDGTLLDHHCYSWEPARSALQALQERGYPLIFNSSKTASEILILRQLLRNYEPFVCENGAVANIPRNYFEPGVAKYKQTSEFETHHFGKTYEEVIGILHELRKKYQFQFQGFDDMTVDELVAVTQLSQEQAQAAKQRQASEPLLWLDSDDKLDRFRSLLKIKGLVVTTGGRFIQVMADANKGEAVEWLRQKYQKLEPRTEWITVGLGDSLNDIPMLEHVDYPVLIANPDANAPDASHIKNLRRSELPGPEGWNREVLDLMNRVT